MSVRSPRERRELAWALLRIFLGAVQLTSAAIGAAFLITAGPGPLAIGMAVLAATTTALSRFLYCEADSKGVESPTG